MLYAVLVPEEPSDGVPCGAAVLAYGRDHRAALVYHDPREPFGERCARASRQPRPIIVPGASVEVGQYDSIDGEVRLNHHGVHSLGRWIGGRVSRGDLVARENRTDRRHRARALFYQGRYAEAFRIDRRMGL